MVKAVFFDIDGTLLSHETNLVPVSAVRALEELRARGILTFAATGRHIEVLEQLEPLRELKLDGAITLNGQYCTDFHKILYHCPIHPADIRTLLAFLEAHPYPCIFVEQSGMYINFHNRRVEEVQAAIHSPLPRIGDLNHGLTNPVYQVCLYMNDEELATLPELPHVRLTRWNQGGVDVIPVGGGKATGIENVLAHYGISKEETLAFGDGENDVDMFRAVGTAIAMGNACAPAKAAAHIVTESVDEDGILNALVRLGVL